MPHKLSLGHEAESVCCNCSLGTYAEQPGSSGCKLADKGYFVDKVGLSNQTRCKAGTHTNAKGRSTCLRSLPGKEVERG